MNRVDALLRASAVTGALPTELDIRAVVTSGTPVERALAHRAVAVAARRLHDRLRVPDADDPDEELAIEIDTTASALSGLACPAGRPA